MATPGEDEVERVLLDARAGSVVAFEAVYQALAPSVASYLRLNGAEDVDDLTNEVFAQLHRGLGRFQGDWSDFRSYVFTIAHRRLVDDRRRRRRRPVVVDDGVEDRPHLDDLEAHALGSMRLSSALGLLKGLSPDQREVLLLRVVSDLSIEDVASSLGKTPGAVKALQHRALASLRRAIDAQEAAR